MNILKISEMMCLALVIVITGLWLSNAVAATPDLQIRTKAQSLAEQADWEVTLAEPVLAKNAQTSTADTHSLAHPLAVQTLSVEKQEIKNEPDTPRMQVFQYHYDLQQARRLTIDTRSETLVSSRSVDSVHLPLNDTEISFAIALTEAHLTLVQKLRDEQIKRGQIAFEQLSDLAVKASIFEPPDQTHECYLQRCALLSLFDDSRTVFTIEPVVNLQQMSVDTLRGM